MLSPHSVTLRNNFFDILHESSFISSFFYFFRPSALLPHHLFKGSPFFLDPCFSPHAERDAAKIR